MGDDDPGVVVVGCGAAGLAAALSAAETVVAGDQVITVTVLERTERERRGGSTAYTGAFLRVNADLSPADGFEQEIMDFSEGRSDPQVVRRLAKETKETLEWVRSHGVAFDELPTSFLTTSRPRVLPVGGGRAIVNTLAESAQRTGVEVAYNTTALGLELTDDGQVCGIAVRDNSSGRRRVIPCRAVILACGGFEGNNRMLTEYLGGDAHFVKNISRGGEQNKGEGIRLALDVGAKASGRWDRFHAEPIDPRSSTDEPALMMFPYCLLVNRHGERFTDEGAGTVDEIYEEMTRLVLKQPGGHVYCVGDQKIFGIRGHDRAIQSPEPPIEAGTVDELATKLKIDDPARFVATVAAYNAATSAGAFDPYAPDGNATHDLQPPKSNWARPLDDPPFVAWPLSCSIVFTFGGLAADDEARVLNDDDAPIDGLYAAGEITGLYYGKYPGATSVLRGLVFGRIAGRNAVGYVRSQD